MRYLCRGLLVAIAPVGLSSCALLLSFNGFDDGSAGDAGGETESASDGRREGSPTGDSALDYVGCYKDNGTNRDLPFMAYTNGNNTIEGCVTSCADYDYQYAGAQNGTQCFCGDRYGLYGPGTCSVMCPGHPAEECGGPYANSIYRTRIRRDSGTD